MKNNKKQDYAIKWNIKLGKKYMENYKKMLEAEKFGEVWEFVVKNEIKALDAFHEELHDMHFKQIGKYLNKILTKKLKKQKEELKNERKWSGQKESMIK